MLTRRIGFLALATVVFGGGSAAVMQSSAAAAPAAPPNTHGIAHLNAQQVNLPAGAWTDIPVQVVLPRAGTYDLDADVRGRLSGVPSVNAYITARLWDVSTGAAVPQSERLVYQMIDLNTGAAEAGGNGTAPISELIRVNGPTTIRIQAVHYDAVGGASIAQIYSDTVGYTSLRYDRVGP